MLPSYLENLTSPELEERKKELLALQKKCRLCPNECNAQRDKGDVGLCHSTDEVIISSFGTHLGEEPPISGQLGSGTIFFTNCNLGCVYCQNYDISQLHHGYGISINVLAKTMLNLQNNGCNNVNFVTPTHFIPQIVEALLLAIDNGFQLPLVYNCGGYESVEALKLLEDIVDIYMPDIKYSESEVALEYSGIKNYWEVVQVAVKEMHRQVGNLKRSKRGIAQRGLLIRHLVLPNNLAGSKHVLNFVAKELSINTYVNIMDQYYPRYKATEINELNRRINSTEFNDIVDYAREIGLQLMN